MGKIVRMRLDELLVARGLAANRSVARGLILAGLVKIDGRLSDKAGASVCEDASITVAERPRFVSRAGEKLAGAVEDFTLDVRGREALDVGASTGGFVDCLLQSGAGRVIALDVGRGQLDPRLRGDERVHVLEGVNARHLEPGLLPYAPDFLTMDVAFISVTKVLPPVIRCMAQDFEGAVLIKPQFEAGRGGVGKGGIVRDGEVHRQVLSKVGAFVVEEAQCELLGLCRSKVRGAGGNVEFFFHIGRGRGKGFGLDRLEEMVERCLAVGEGIRGDDR